MPYDREDLPPADMTFTEEEVYGTPRADMTFTEEEVYGTPPADMTFTEEEVYGIGQVHDDSLHPGGGEHGHDPLHLAHQGLLAVETGHLVAEGVHLAHEAHEAHPIADAARAGVTIAAEAPNPVMAGVGVPLGLLTAAAGTHQTIEGIENNDATEVVGGGLNIAAGSLTTGSSIAALAGSTALAPVAAVASSAAVGYGLGREVIDPLGGQAAGGLTRTLLTEEQELAQQHRTRQMATSDDPLERAAGEMAMLDTSMMAGREERVGRGLDGGTEVVDRDARISDRIAEAMAGGPSGGAVSDAEIDRAYQRGQLGRDMATHLPSILGGDRRNSEFFGGDEFNAAFGVSWF
jgi:hypothetical protein